MRTKYKFFCTILILLLQFGYSQQTKQPNLIALPAVRDLVFNTVVYLAPLDRNYEPIGSSGSGSVISPNGYILTNYHVIEDRGQPSQYVVVAFTESKYESPTPRYIAVFHDGSRDLDIAVLKITMDTSLNRVSPTNMQAMTIGHIDDTEHDDELDIWGYPGVGGSTITSANGTIAGYNGEDRESGGQSWIKTDSNLKSGNSGGAAITSTGLLVGIPTLYDRMNEIELQGYLRPANLAVPFLRDVPNVDYSFNPLSYAPAPPPSTSTSAITSAALPIQSTINMNSVISSSVEGSEITFHEINISESGRYSFIVESIGNDSDPMIALFDSNLDMLHENDDGWKTSDSLIDYVQLERGEYFLGVASYDDADITYLAFASNDRPVTLPYSTQMQMSNESGKVFYIPSRSSDQRVTAVATSQQFDTTLEVINFDTGERVAFNDDAGSGTDSEIEFTLHAGTDYYIRVGTYGYSPSEGSFNLLVTPNTITSVPPIRAAAPARPPSAYGSLDAAGRPNQSLQIGSDAIMTLASQETNGWSYQSNTRRRIRLLTSDTAIDTTITVTDSSGDVIGYNDDINYPDNLNSELYFYTEVGERYTIKVTNISGTSGSYTLISNFLAAPASTANNSANHFIHTSSNYPRDTRQRQWDAGKKIRYLGYLDNQYVLVMSDENEGELGSQLNNRAAESYTDFVYNYNNRASNEKVIQLSVAPPYWYYVMERGSNYGLQAFNYNRSFPDDWVDDQYKSGYYITSIDYGKTSSDAFWVVVMSQVSNRTDQRILRGGLNNSLNRAKDLLESSPQWNITNIASDGNTWYIIVSRDTDAEDVIQNWNGFSSIESLKEYVSLKEAEGFSFNDIAYGDGTWVAVVAK